MGKWIANWLETRWVTPSYAGWLLLGLSIFFFGAATNTLSGWLYVISGVIFALLVVGAILPERSLRRLQITRVPIEPVSAGNDLTIELILENAAASPKTLIQVQDLLPHVLDQPVKTVVEMIPAQDTYRWVYYQPTQRRGVYRWHEVQLRTGTPIGLFWCRRSREVKAKAIVYPTILPLSRCPLVDEIGREENLQYSSNRRSQVSTEGLTRALRPYRWGDPIRSIHWRTSARYGQFRVRELETLTGGQDLVICLDSAIPWQTEDFEQAVIATASLYFYALKQNSYVRLWTAATGLVKGVYPGGGSASHRIVLETLAAVNFSETEQSPPPDEFPLIWLTQNPARLSALPYGSRWVLWSAAQNLAQPIQVPVVESPGLIIRPNEELQLQLQAAPERR